MKPLRYPLLADENIDPEVIAALSDQGKVVRSIGEEGLSGATDSEILHHAHQRGWVVLTHDSDFGALAVRRGEPYLGLIYLRPGHIRAEAVLEMLATLDRLDQDLDPPFIVVAERRSGRVRVRFRPRPVL